MPKVARAKCALPTCRARSPLGGSGPVPGQILSGGWPTAPGWVTTSVGFTRVYLCSIEHHAEWCSLSQEEREAVTQ